MGGDRNERKMVVPNDGRMAVNGLREKSFSLWPFLLNSQVKFLNPLYDSNSQKSTVLEPNTVPFNFRFWRNMYHQFDTSMHPRQSVPERILKLNEENKVIEESIGVLETKLKKQKNKMSDDAQNYTKDLLQSVRPVSPNFQTSGSFIKDQVRKSENGVLQTMGINSITDNRYTEYAEEFSKSDPVVVSLEYGIARMTC